MEIITGPQPNTLVTSRHFESAEVEPGAHVEIEVAVRVHLAPEQGCERVQCSSMAWSPPALERRKWFVEQTRDYATNLFPPHPRRHLQPLWPAAVYSVEPLAPIWWA